MLVGHSKVAFPLWSWHPDAELREERNQEFHWQLRLGILSFYPTTGRRVGSHCGDGTRRLRSNSYRSCRCNGDVKPTTPQLRQCIRSVHGGGA